jgi:hypothetical protein
MTKHQRPLDPKYFRDLAKILGCENVDNMGDLDVWNYILVKQGKEPIYPPLEISYGK